MARKKQELAAPQYKDENIPVPELNDDSKPVPEVTEENIETPQVNTEQKKVPQHKPVFKPVPEFENTQKSPPPSQHQENCITVGGKLFEIKPTKIKYQRDRTAAFYRILQQMPLVDILALQDGILDPERSSDKMLFDWLVAVTDDPKFVTLHYNEFDSEIIERCLKIFCRLNKIDDREERKNHQAQVTNH